MSAFVRAAYGNLTSGSGCRESPSESEFEFHGVAWHGKQLNHVHPGCEGSAIAIGILLSCKFVLGKKSGGRDLLLPRCGPGTARLKFGMEEARTTASD